MSGEVEGEEGVKLLEAIKSRTFLPIIFYTKLPNKVRDLAVGVPLIQVVEKTEGVERLLSVIKEILSTGVPDVNRALIQHIRGAQRDYMWKFVAENLSYLGSPDRKSLAYLLARRLAISLSGPGMRKVAERLSNSLDTTTENDLTHPTRYYIMPPIEDFPLAGDIYRYARGQKWPYAILLTPSCDFVSGPTRREKVQRALFAHCLPLDSEVEFIRWRDEQFPDNGSSKKRLTSLLKNKRDITPERFYFLPSSLSIPDLIIDYQQLYTMPLDRLKKMEKENKIDRIASIDSPFSEAILSRFVRYFGRLGTPDLDIECIFENIKRNQTASSHSP